MFPKRPGRWGSPSSVAAVRISRGQGKRKLKDNIISPYLRAPKCPCGLYPQHWLHSGNMSDRSGLDVGVSIC